MFTPINVVATPKYGLFLVAGLLASRYAFGKVVLSLDACDCF